MDALKTLLLATTALAGDKRGNVALLFGISLFPIVGAVGAGLDYSNANRVRSQLQVALDSAALAGAKELKKPDSEVRAAVRAYLDANLPPELRNLPFDLKIDDKRTTVDISMKGTVDANFMKLMGISQLDVGTKSQATVGIDSAEIVLALDTTGTMRQHIPALQQGTKELLNILFRASVTGSLKVGMVPYVTSVNLGSHPSRMNWMDANADAKHHGENFEGVKMQDSRCDTPKPPSPPKPPGPPPPPPPPPPKPPWSPDLGRLDAPVAPVYADAGDLLPLNTAGDAQPFEKKLVDAVGALFEAFGPTSAQASGSPNWPYGNPNDDPKDCNRTTPNKVNHFDLFNAMKVSWKGCVEARPFPFDVDDVAPNRGVPDSLFVPWLWPDESDKQSKNIRNNYLPDTTAMPGWLKNKNDEALRQAWIWKYRNGPKPNIDDTSFLTRGPNAACPEPIVPLTDNKGRLDSAVNALRAYAASGTNISEGLAWAWRVVSPGEPFAEGAAYGERNKKFIVLMTDGFNEVVPQGVNWNKSDYSSVGYAAKKRLSTDDLVGMTQELDRRLTRVCDNIRAKDIQVFTLLYDPVGYTQRSDVESRLKNCATTKDRHFFKASSSSDLIKAFNEIANEITKLRLSK